MGRIRRQPLEFKAGGIWFWGDQIWLPSSSCYNSLKGAMILRKHINNQFRIFDWATHSIEVVRLGNEFNAGGPIGQPAELLRQPGHPQSLLHHQPGHSQESEGHRRLLFPVTFYILLSTVFQPIERTEIMCFRNVTMRTYESLSHCNIIYTRINSFADFSVKNARYWRREKLSIL